MLAHAIRVAIDHRILVITVCALVAAAGVWSFFQQPIDAYPDISAQQVLIISTYPGRAPEEVERQVTVPIELAMGSTPNVSVIRSRTIFGLSIVELIFDEGVDKYFARQRVQERLGNVQLPTGVTTELGPLATAYGEVYRYELKSDGPHDEMELRTLNDWVVIPRLQRTPGVAEVANFGGLEKQYTLKLDPVRLERFGMTLDNIVDAIKTNNANAGGSVLRRGDMSFVIRGRGSFVREEDIEATVVNAHSGTPVFLRDVATVELDSRLPAGIFAKDSVTHAVEGIVLMRRGENPSQVLRRVEAEAADLNANVLPEGVKITPFYDRQYLVDGTLHTVAHSVLAGITLVLCVLLAFLGSPALATLVVLTVPFALLFALVLMYFTNIPIGLLSLGAIDFGILVDGAVIMADNIAHRLTERDESVEDVSDTVLNASVEVQRPIFFSMLMIICAYLPLLSLTSIEGLLFRPMAMTVVFALIGAVAFAILVLPPLASLVLRRGYQDWENPALRMARPYYGRVVRFLMRWRWGVLVGMIATMILVCVALVPRMGFDFLPYLDEGVIWVRANFPEGTSLEQTSRFGDEMRQIVHELPDVTFVTSQAGRNDSGTDPFVPSRVEMMIGLKPIDQWVFSSKQELVATIGKRLREEFPTTRFNFTQPIIDSVTEATNGTSANLAVEFSGQDPEELRRLGRQTAQLLKQVRGATDVNIEQEGPQPQLVIAPDRERCARYGVHIDEVNTLINVALGGEGIGTFFDQERRFDIVARFGREFLTSTESIGRLPVFNESGQPIPLAQVANFSLKDGQTFIAREGGRRRITVRSDIVGRDQGSFVAEAQRLFAKEMTVPDGYRVRWIGMFENLERASRHFLVVIPITVGIIYVLLLMTFGTQRETLMVLLSIPFAFVGGAIALYVRGMTFNVSSGVGFAALFGVSIMNGVLMVEWISKLRRSGCDLEEAIVDGAQARLRPILMASLVAILGLVPASMARGLGSDVQRPLATVIVWGLVSSMVLSLLVLPALYRLMPPKLPVDAQKDTGP
ncbi:MAG: efflux RND transporter permease subunit [Planctomycetia bacterium]|nr:efflux RND transporter permease subunit [Planctomycetia bacterium]